MTLLIIPSKVPRTRRGRVKHNLQRNDRFVVKDYFYNTMREKVRRLNDSLAGNQSVRHFKIDFGHH